MTSTPPWPPAPPHESPSRPTSPIQDVVHGQPDPHSARGRWSRWREGRRERRKRAWQGRRDQMDECCAVASCLDEGCYTWNRCMSMSLWLNLVGVLAYAMGHRPRDPHTAAPDSRIARAAWELVRSYQLVVSARRKHPVCAMTPSCSRYALQALSRHGFAHGGWLVIRRLRRCSRRHPAYDPVP